MKSILLIIFLAACADVYQTVDDGTSEFGVDVGHKWKLDLIIQFGYPAPISFQHDKGEACILEGGQYEWLRNWVDTVCWPAIDSPDSPSPGNGDCGGEMDPENWDLCFPDNQ